MLHDSEAQVLAATGASIASCPMSNILFARSALPINRFRALGVEIGLGTDVAGGHSLNMLSAIRTAGLISRVHGFVSPEREKKPEKIAEGNAKVEEYVDWKTALYCATRGGARAVGWEKVGVLEVGWKWDAQEVEVGWDEEEEEEEAVEMMLERWVVGHGTERDVKRV